MIILKHLTVERFRLLREVNLHFPQRGSILIQGPNEAGKSALFESIYFALYGEPLNSEQGKRTLDDLIHYGASNAVVMLTFAVGAKELTVKRTIERGKWQQVSLVIRRLGLPEEEPITRVGVANERIISELGQMDSETLRNSYFIEQKGLGRLETLRGFERETALRKLLGLEKLRRMTEHFKVTEADEQQLTSARERLKLAEMQARIPELSARLARVEAALDAVTVSDDLAEISSQQTEIAEQELVLDQIRQKRVELKNRQGRLQQLKKAEATLSEIIDSYDAIAEARREIPELERQINELERREREELPALEHRVSELADLSRSFGTLERLAADLLTTVNTIKELEEELKQHQLIQNDLKELDEQIVEARLQVEQARQKQFDLDEQRRASRPQLEARFVRLQKLTERLGALRSAEIRYAQEVMNQGLSEENEAKLKKIQKDLQETEQELKLVENEARQIQLQAEAVEKNWRQVGIRRQLEEWQRLKGLSQGLAEAERHVMLAHQQQEQLTAAALTVRRNATTRLGLLIACVVLTILAGGAAAVEALQNSPYIATGAGMAAILLVAGAAYSLFTYNKARELVATADQQMQEATTKVSMMVAAREAAVRMGGDHKALAQVEYEIRSLGGEVPRTLEEASRMLQMRPDHGESLADIQQQMNEKRDSLTAARNQVNVTMEALAALRKERAALEEQRQKENLGDLASKMAADKAELEKLQKEIAALAGEEGLPIPSFDAALSLTATGNSELQKKLEELIKATEREIAILDGRIEVVSELSTQIKIQQEALDGLLTRKEIIAARRERFRTPDPQQQIERAREQQANLRSALQSLQDSLRQRVKPLGVAFGQAAISSAETAARKQLEMLHITLGNRVELQSRHATYSVALRERQDSLSDHYKQLAKFSASLGSWIIPLNPFADALQALRARCQREIQEADEQNIQQSREALQIQEAACNAKIELCKRDIEDANERIATMLAQRSRPQTKAYTFTDIVAVWPLVGEYTSEARTKLEEERVALEQRLQELEQQELTQSEQLQASGNKIDLEQARLRMEQQERSYETKKRGSLLVTAVGERLMKKMLPRTEYYMRQLLPLLTSGRYHDLHLITKPEEGAASGGPLELQVWDSAASEYVTKSALSGGASDQLSFALRLAFAIASLPRELGAAPGFILLDEPLSSFDRRRMQALVDVVTGDILSQHFEQVFFISQSTAFDPSIFPYHVYMENGTIVESNLPVVSMLPTADTVNSSEMIMQTPIPASLAVEVE